MPRSSVRARVHALMLLAMVERKPVLSNCITLWKAEASAVGEKLALTAMRREKRRKTRNGEGRGGGREQYCPGRSKVTGERSDGN